jgi:hypothetical protein
MPAGRINGLTVAYTAIGGLVLWSGIAGTSLSATFKGALVGQSPSQLPSTEPITAAAAPAASGAAAPAGNTGAASPTAAANQATAKILAAPYGWSSGPQWDALVALWNQESGWSTTALNASSGATGIPQLNPQAHAVPPGWSSAAVQIAWGLAYIKGRYGSPLAAWQFDTSNGLQGY